jgi:hypothetical protein
LPTAQSTYSRQNESLPNGWHIVLTFLPSTSCSRPVHEWLKTVFWLVIGFIDFLQPVTTINSSSLSHTLCNWLQHAPSILNQPCLHKSLVTA